MTFLTKILVFILSVGLILTASFYWNVHFNANFGVITPGKVYKSGAISPEKIENYIHMYKIKTVIDLRGGVANDTLNPEVITDILAERFALSAIDTVKYVHIPSAQVPTEAQIEAFLNVLDGDDVFPVLLHGHHGTEMAMMYSSIYRIEHEGVGPDEARKRTSNIVWGSRFDHGTEKGEFLKHYIKSNSSRQLNQALK